MQLHKIGPGAKGVCAQGFPSLSEGGEATPGIVLPPFAFDCASRWFGSGGVGLATVRLTLRVPVRLVDRCKGRW